MRLCRPLLLPLFALALPSLLFAGAEEPASVRLLLSNSAPYIGEEVVLTLEVRYRQRPGGTMAVRWPQLNGCISSELPPLLPRREEGMEGPLVVESARRLLRPLNAGRFNLSGGIELRQQFLAAPPLSLRVRPLPTAGRPEAFAGAIGTAEMELRAAGTGSREVRLVLRGDAPLDTFPPPRADFGRNERLIALGEAFSGNDGGMRERTFRYLYMPGPARRGELAFRLDIFDPSTGTYRLLQAGLGEAAPPPPIPPRGWAGLLLAPLLLLALLLRRRRRNSLDHLLRRFVGRPVDGLSRDAVVACLRRSGARDESVAALLSFWAAEDRDRFAPSPRTARKTSPPLKRQVARQLANDIDKRRRIP